MTAARRYNPNCWQTHASFRIAAPGLDPKAVTEALSIKPTGTFDRPSDPATPCVWSLSSEERLFSSVLEDHLCHLLDLLLPARERVRAVLDQSSAGADFFCYWVSRAGHGGPELTAQILGDIASLDAALGIDFYRREPDEPPGESHLAIRTYSLFYDVPRLALVQWDERWFVLDCSFEEGMDEFPDVYTVYELPAPVLWNDQTFSRLETLGRRLGVVSLDSLDSLGFDGETRRYSIAKAALAPLVETT